MKNKHGHHVTALKKKGYKRGLTGQGTGVFKKYACFMNAYQKGLDERKKQELVDLVLQSPSEAVPRIHIPQLKTFVQLK